MTAVNTPSVREMLLSDAYWEGPIVDPCQGMSAEDRNQYDEDRYATYSDLEKTHEIGNVVLSLRGGGSLHNLEEGDTIPLPSDNPRQVVKIVEDTRTVIPRFKPKPENYRLQKRLEKRAAQLAERNGGFPTFDALAELMSQPNVYIWISAISIVKRSRDILVVRRDVGYMRAGHGKLGAMLKGSYVGDSQEADQAQTVPIPQLAVGEIYKREHDSLAKVSSAAVMEANGILWTHNKRGSVKKNKERRKLGWLPSFEALSQ